MDGSLLDKSEEIRAQMTDILAAQALCEPADLQPDTSLESIGIDSLGLAEIIFSIEESFDVAVPFNANEPGENELDLSTVGSVCAAVETLVRSQKG